MKEAIHPDYHVITIKMTNGVTYETRSTWGKPGDVLQLDVDPNTHPAWNAGSFNVRKTGQTEKFNKKFSFLSSDKKAAAPKAEAKAAAPKADAKKSEKKAEKKADKKDEA